MSSQSSIPAEIQEDLQKVKVLRQRRGLTTRKLGTILGTACSSISNWESGATCPTPENLARIRMWLQQAELSEAPRRLEIHREAKERSEQLKHLLNMLEFHLRYFQDGLAEARDTYRRELDVYDVGYLTSMLEMLFDEDKFQRWKVFTTHRFGGFRRKRDGGKGKDKGKPR